MSSYDDSDAFEAAASSSLAARAMSARTSSGLTGGPQPYLDGLNPAQLEAVHQLAGPVLMLAGAGTGKTRALTARIAHLLSTGHARPNEILAVTFTNKAAREMKNRVGHLLGQPAEGMPWLGTFHAICVKLLRRHAELAGLKSNFTILDTDDQNRLLKQLIIAAEIDDKRWPVRALGSIIDGWKNRALTPDKVPTADHGAFNHRGVELYAQYQTRLTELNACDFGDLLMHVIRIFQENEDLLAQYQRWFRYILVDEYQDTNVAQYLWLRLLAAGHKNICCVGDDDQSIYGWRGAEVGNILRFEKDFPGAKIVRLEQNYRSTGHILAAASGVIEGNKGRLGKTLFTDKEHGNYSNTAGGEKVRLIGHWDGDEEARWVGEEIEAMGQGTRGMDPIGPNSIAILVRASHQMRAFEDRFLTIGLPYRVIGGPRFYERMEIRDAMAYFRMVVSPDDDLAFERIVNTPKRGLGDKAQQTIQRMARSNGVSLLEGARLCVETKAIGGKGGKELGELVEGIARWRRMLLGIRNVPNTGLGSRSQTADTAPEGGVNDEPVTAFQDIGYDLDLAGDPIRSDEDILIDDDDRGAQPTEPVVEPMGGPRISHIELAEIILDESGYTAHWQNDKTPEAPGRLENLKELVKALESFENLQGFLEHVSLIMDNESDDQEPKVTLMTLHAAKGLEFPAIFLPGWEDGLFPSQRSMDESGITGLEEERRLAYVGITRAEEVCTISFAGNRRVYGQWQSQMPSRFIDELPEAHVEVLTPPGLYGHQGGMSASASPVEQTMAGSNLHERAARADVYNSPGWRRLQANQGQRGLRQPSEAKTMTIDAEAVSAFSIGDRVFHQKFGYGEVMHVEGDKLAIEFDKAGSKHVVGRFLVAAGESGDVPF